MLQLGQMKGLIGLLVGFILGAMCRWLDIPVPSPPKLLGALLVVATTIGYMTADRFLTKQVSEPAQISSTSR
jgi:XapX domain-containing protein